MDGEPCYLTGGELSEGLGIDDVEIARLLNPQNRWPGSEMPGPAGRTFNPLKPVRSIGGLTLADFLYNR